MAIEAKCSHGTPFGERCSGCEDCVHGVWHGADLCSVCAPESEYVAAGCYYEPQTVRHGA